MGNMLQFKMGQFAGLANQGIAPGTVYVTTDEKALYVDVPANDQEAAKRIRIGDVIQVQDVDALLSFAPDYDTNALYYVIEENALMKYTGNGTTHKWQQINSVEGVATDLSKLDTRVTTAEGQITTLETSLGTNNDQANTPTAFGRIKSLEGKMTAAEGEIDELQTLTANQGTAIAALQNVVGTGESGAGTLVSRVGTLESNVNTINATIGEVEENETVVSMIGNALKNAQDYADQAEKDAVTTAASDATSKADNALASAKTYTDNQITTTTTTINNTIGTVPEGQTVVSMINAVDAAVEAALAEAKTYADTAESDAVNTAASDATTKANNALKDAKTYTDDQITTVTAKIGTVSEGQTVVGMIEAVDNAVDAAIITAASDATTKAENALKAAKAYADTAESDAIASAKTYTDGHITTINATIGAVNDAATANTVYGAIAKAEVDAVATAKTYTDNMLRTADAMTFKGVLGGTGANVTSLPAAEAVKAGDTYKIGAEDNNGYGTGHKVKVGDLLIALRDGESNYVHISSGYEDDYDSRLGVDLNNNKIVLKDAMLDPNGSVQFVGDGENGSVKVQVTATEDATTGIADSKVTISLQWGSF